MHISFSPVLTTKHQSAQHISTALFPPIDINAFQHNLYTSIISRQPATYSPAAHSSTCHERRNFSSHLCPYSIQIYYLLANYHTYSLPLQRFRGCRLASTGVTEKPKDHLYLSPHIPKKYTSQRSREKNLLISSFSVSGTQNSSSYTFLYFEFRFGCRYRLLHR